ncbi:hypothetical protein A2G96_28280 [Cupriavidus nantongensis]|uniref:Uncharacterized protein n=1 Tax=Cupriavidus nantongensis TaxID=1796606 RepID=A0A142JUA6_9BURK|nr:hypothetical protein A2G96_28280 [Cupriavidus nantongensis]
MRKITAQYTTREMMDVCRKMDIPVAEMYSIHSIQNHPQVQSTGLFQTMAHPTEDEVVTTRPTALFSKTPASIYKPAPNLGEDTERILNPAP